MISTKEQVVTGLAELNDAQLQTVAEFLEFLKFRERRKFETQLDDSRLEALYAEFADEDRELAEAGLAEYAANLEREDAAQ
jgi:ABC-type phosphate transport system auxiliary subunit